MGQTLPNPLGGCPCALPVRTRRNFTFSCLFSVPLPPSWEKAWWVAGACWKRCTREFQDRYDMNIMGILGGYHQTLPPNIDGSNTKPGFRLIFGTGKTTKRHRSVEGSVKLPSTNLLPSPPYQIAFLAFWCRFWSNEPEPPMSAASSLKPCCGEMKVVSIFRNDPTWHPTGQPAVFQILTR